MTLMTLFLPIHWAAHGTVATLITFCLPITWETHGTPAARAKGKVTLEKMTIWQPIATAPTDGTQVWLAEPYPGGFHQHAGSCRDGNWYMHDQQTGSSWEVKPTHWYPLPAEPLK